MPSRSRKLFWVAGLLLGANLAQADEKTTLRYRFEPGRQLTYQLSTGQQSEISSDMVPGAVQKTAIHWDVSLDQVTRAVDGSVASMELQFKHFAAHQLIEGKKVPIEATAQMNKIRLGLKMTDRGEMSEARLLQADELSKPAQRVAESLRRSLVQNSLVLPSQAVGPGDSWQHELTMPANLPAAPELEMKLSIVYRLDAVENHRGRRCARISSAGELSLQGEAKKTGAPLAANLKGKARGTTWFAIDAGLLVDSQAELQLQGQITAAAGEQKVNTQVKIDLKAQVALQ